MSQYNSYTLGIIPDAEDWTRLTDVSWMFWLVRKYGVHLDDSKLRHYAADCAEDVLSIFESEFPDDDRPRRAIQAARDFSDAKISVQELETLKANVLAVVNDYSNVPARVAARSAAMAAETSISTVEVALRAALLSAEAAAMAARNAAWVSDKSTAWGIAEAVASATQAERLRSYFKNPFGVKP
jgi:hypothetical protein